MSRILCVTDPLGPGAGAATLAACRQAVAALEDRAGVGAVEVGVLGTSDAARLARECGLMAAWRIPVPCGNVRLAEPTLARIAQRQAHDVVLAWGERPARLVSRVMPDAPLVVVLDAVCEAARVRHAELAEVLCLGQALADRAVLSGWLPIRIRAVVPPMPGWQPIPSLDRNSLRRIWSADEEDLVIGVLPLSPGRGDAMFALHAMGRFALAGHGAHLVLDPGMNNVGSVRSLARRIGLNGRVHFDSSLNCPWKISPAVDLWISLCEPRRDETALHACSAAALGAPILASAGSFAAAEIERQADGIVSENSVNAFALELIHANRNRESCRRMATQSRVKYGAQSVRDGFARAIQENVERVCPEVFAAAEIAGRSPAARKFAAAST